MSLVLLLVLGCWVFQKSWKHATVDCISKDKQILYLRLPSNRQKPNCERFISALNSCLHFKYFALEEILCELMTWMKQLSCWFWWLFHQKIRACWENKIMKYFTSRRDGAFDYYSFSKQVFLEIIIIIIYFAFHTCVLQYYVIHFREHTDFLSDLMLGLSKF